MDNDYNDFKPRGLDNPITASQRKDFTERAMAGDANQRQVGGAHYQSSVQHWDYVAANNLGYFEAQIVKYVTRWHQKGGVQDLRKAQHFIDKLVENIERKEWGGTNASGSSTIPA